VTASRLRRYRQYAGSALADSAGHGRAQAEWWDKGTGGALFYHAAGTRAPWSASRVRTAWIGRHVYYR
jgi:spore germination cell wall hydrolase CwlJ-like protein